MKRRRRIGRHRLLALAIVCGFDLSGASAEDWYRVQSGDGRASVLFPNPADEVRELVDKTPGGKVVTRVAEHHGDGILMTISGSKLPRLAMTFAGPKVIFNNAKGSVLSKAYGSELSSEHSEIEGADAALVMRYEAPDLENEGHPGYTGLAVFVIVGKHIYVVNSAINKKTPDNEAMQKKLLGSIQIHQ